MTTSGGGASDEQVAKDVETYIRENVKELPETKTPSDNFLSGVQAEDGKVRVVTYLNDGLPADHAAAKEICRAVEQASVEGVEETTIVDAGDTDMERC